VLKCIFSNDIFCWESNCISKTISKNDFGTEDEGHTIDESIKTTTAKTSTTKNRERVRSTEAKESIF
jgi:hypothetical protein